MRRSIRSIFMLLGGIGTGLALGICMAPGWVLLGMADEWGTFIYTMQRTAVRAAKIAELAAQPPAASLPPPVVGLRQSAIADTFGAPRSDGRTHEGLDFFAVRGTRVRSVTEGVVLRIGVGELGGNYVFILGPGGERYYYAHLDAVDPALMEGQVVTPLTPIGTVGTTGNAEGTVPHLHFGIYGQGGARNPYERLVAPYAPEQNMVD